MTLEKKNGGSIYTYVENSQISMFLEEFELFNFDTWGRFYVIFVISFPHNCRPLFHGTCHFQACIQL